MPLDERQSALFRTRFSVSSTHKSFVCRSKGFSGDTARRLPVVALSLPRLFPEPLRMRQRDVLTVDRVLEPFHEETGNTAESQRGISIASVRNGLSLLKIERVE
jgi:hypothetical protein